MLYGEIDTKAIRGDFKFTGRKTESHKAQYTNDKHEGIGRKFAKTGDIHSL